MSARAKLNIRKAVAKDLRAICRLYKKVYPEDTKPYSIDCLRGQLNNYPEGQFVAEYEGVIVGYCASLRLPEKKVMAAHTWSEITGNGYGTTHDPEGDYLYGMEIFVDPDFRGIKIGERFYRQRRQLCKHLRLKGIVFGARMPLLRRRLKKIGGVEEYVKLVLAKKIRDPVLGFQIRHGFEVKGVLPGYLPSDKESMGYAAHLVWSNPEAEVVTKERDGTGRLPDTVRVAVVQYRQRGIRSFSEFEEIITYFVDVVADYNSDFVLFPELLTLQLLSIENEPIPPNKAIATLTKYTDQLRAFFSGLAIKYNVNIIAGSHPTRLDDGDIHNVSYVYLRDGSIHTQEKLHPTPSERYWWQISGGESLSVINTDCGPIGVLICYDSEFPELARHLVNQGANILFVPFCTDERQSYLRVRYCAQARAVENQMYVAMAGNVGNLPRVHNMDIQYAQSCILSPCDFPFARDGIAADTEPNVETVAFADLRLENLRHARQEGTVQNLKDRRHDLYQVSWTGKSSETTLPGKAEGAE